MGALNVLLGVIMAHEKMVHAGHFFLKTPSFFFTLKYLTKPKTKFQNEMTIVKLSQDLAKT